MSAEKEIPLARGDEQGVWIRKDVWERIKKQLDELRELRFRMRSLEK